MHDVAGFGILIAIALMGVAQFIGRRMGRDARRERERLAALAPIRPRTAAPAAPAAPAARRPATAARPPQRANRAPAEPRPARLPVMGPQAGGPRWAANAFIAAEVFGPPVADRPARSAQPGGTLGPPNAF